jgi:AcrR family transcriptional regulator
MKIKQSALSIASECFAKYGYDKTSIKILSTSMDISISTFYAQYKGKDALFKVVLEDEIDRFKFFIIRGIAKHTKPMDKLCVYIITRTMGLQQLKNLLLVINNKRLSKRYLVKRLTQKYKKDEDVCVKNIVESGVESGAFQIENTTLIATAIISVLIGMGQSLNQFSNIEKSKEKLYQVLNLLLFGVIKV